jgi:hypothetical protein
LSDRITLAADCTGGAETGLDRVREVLDLVLAPRPAWPSTDEWARILPAWFVAQCTDDVRVQNCVIDKWSLRAWVWWFQPDQRRFRVVDARAAGERLELVLEPTGQGSLLTGALEWLLKCAGCRLIS